MINWMFQSSERLKRVILMTVVAVPVMLVLLTVMRFHGSADPATVPTSASTPEPTSTGLLPPSPAVQPASATPSYGASTPVALEAVQAFLQGDRARFGELAQADAVESVNDAPTPGGQITGPGEIGLGGPTQQDVTVPTSDGDLTLIMIIVDGAWKVASMEYAR